MAIAFRAGYWNIGAEGQLLMGAVAAAGDGPDRAGLAALVVLPLMVAAGALAGAAWALVPALLRVRLGIDEVVTTLLLNPVALLVVKALAPRPVARPGHGLPGVAAHRGGRRVPRSSSSKSRLHLGFILALVIIVVAWYVLAAPPTGLRLRAVGPVAARARASPASRSSGRCCAWPS